ncbi:hypothetical protein BDV26DRAFT_289687 [Aspergillus bertholletiae]|uniref:Uncharacterized protein n=1 Tax=Aspergillus bertholletiae TaxID=1226010 RepID=A0A5N7BHD9_9EURO|nr:hypothetical protein BDV26DRAFT_289687 [Aspergillus bertholletiae]
MNSNIIIAIVVLLLLSITGLAYAYSLRWRSHARAQLFMARAEARKRQISERQSQPPTQAAAAAAAPPIQVTVVRGPSCAPARRVASPRTSVSRRLGSPPPPPPLPVASFSSMANQEKRGRSRPGEEWRGSRQRSGPDAWREQSRMSKKQKKREKKKQKALEQQQIQTGQIVDDGWGAGDVVCSGGGGQPAQQECSNQTADDEWGAGQCQPDNTQHVGQQDEQPQPGPDNNEWTASNEAVAGSPGGPVSPDAEWINTGDSGGQQEAPQGTWHAHDAMEQRTEQQQTDTRRQREPNW